MLDKIGYALLHIIGIVFLIFWAFVVVIFFPHIAMPALVFGIAVYGLMTGQIKPEDLRPKEKKKEPEVEFFDDGTIDRNYYV